MTIKQLAIDNMLTVSETAKILHIHPNTLRRWADKGVIKSYCITPRGDRRFTTRDIDQFLIQMNPQNQGSLEYQTLLSSVPEIQGIYRVSLTQKL
jgi:excisionase family DNA binding protein